MWPHSINDDASTTHLFDLGLLTSIHCSCVYMCNQVPKVSSIVLYCTLYCKKIIVILVPLFVLNNVC